MRFNRPLRALTGLVFATVAIVGVQASPASATTWSKNCSLGGYTSTATVDYTYNASTGKITVNKVTGKTAYPGAFKTVFAAHYSAPGKSGGTSVSISTGQTGTITFGSFFTATAGTATVTTSFTNREVGSCPVTFTI